MLQYILKRVGLMVFTLWFIITITFTAMYFMPGNPYPNADRLPLTKIEELDHTYGFDRPYIVQYADYMTNITGLSGLITTEKEGDADSIFGFEMGYSFSNTGDVSKTIAKAYPISLQLGLTSVIFGTIMGVALGLVASIKKNSFWDYFATFIAVLGVSFPSFVLASYNQYIFSVTLGIMPTMYSKGDLLSIILPVVSLSVFAISQVARVTRTEMIDVLGSNYITLAKAKGVSNKKVVFKHAFRNILVAVITILGPITVALTTGSLVIESIFAIPGIGKNLVPAVLSNDVYLVLGTTIVISLQILVMYLIVDILYVFVDPRIKLAGGKNE
ncbi:ABC transporter permease [Mollicutes bacterium LVI A0078]|nr:ABC transporter permease [Mollicutes bacterium LVI A0075]WOO91204.1 ABC transporter permease [Mollicutes bacterium LVI A0078]